jgi:hypothetical protein
MSRAHNFLVVTIETYLGDEAEAFWKEYNRLERLDARDSEANRKRRYLRFADKKIAEWQAMSDEPDAAAQIKHYEEMRDRHTNWLKKYGYAETEE